MYLILYALVAVTMFLMGYSLGAERTIRLSNLERTLRQQIQQQEEQEEEQEEPEGEEEGKPVLCHRRHRRHSPPPPPVTEIEWEPPSSRASNGW
jgi:hypothetical protein